MIAIAGEGPTEASAPQAPKPGGSLGHPPEDVADLSVV